MPTTIPDRAHGTLNGYNYYGCRCGKCSEASRAAHRRIRAERLLRGAPESAHGTWNGYNNYRCRCGACLDAGHARLATRVRVAHPRWLVVAPPVPLRV